MTSLSGNGIFKGAAAALLAVSLSVGFSGSANGQDDTQLAAANNNTVVLEVGRGVDQEQLDSAVRVFQQANAGSDCSLEVRSGGTFKRVTAVVGDMRSSGFRNPEGATGWVQDLGICS